MASPGVWFQSGKPFWLPPSAIPPKLFFPLQANLAGTTWRRLPGYPDQGQFLTEATVEWFCFKSFKKWWQVRRVWIAKWITMDNWPTVFVTASAVSHLVNRVNYELLGIFAVFSLIPLVPVDGTFGLIVAKRGIGRTIWNPTGFCRLNTA